MSEQKKEKVYQEVVNFLEDNNITCGEDIYQRDLSDETNQLLEGIIDILGIGKEKPELKKYYFTFGLGTELKYKYQLILAYSYEQARAAMNEVHGDQWAFMYPEHEFVGSPYFKNLLPLPVITKEEI